MCAAVHNNTVSWPSSCRQDVVLISLYTCEQTLEGDNKLIDEFGRLSVSNLVPDSSSRHPLTFGEQPRLVIFCCHVSYILTCRILLYIHRTGGSGLLRCCDPRYPPWDTSNPSRCFAVKAMALLSSGNISKRC